jgi:hypothetical protein
LVVGVSGADFDFGGELSGEDVDGLFYEVHEDLSGGFYFVDETGDLAGEGA